MIQLLCLQDGEDINLLLFLPPRILMIGWGFWNIHLNMISVMLSTMVTFVYRILELSSCRLWKISWKSLELLGVDSYSRWTNLLMYFLWYLDPQKDQVDRWTIQDNETYNICSRNVQFITWSVQLYWCSDKDSFRDPRTNQKSNKRRRIRYFQSNFWG